MNDDFNTPILIANIFDAVKFINKVNQEKANISKEDWEVLLGSINSFVFEVMGLQRVQIGHDVANKGSQRVIEKTGFQYEGLQRNMCEVTPPSDVLENGWLGTGNIQSYAMIPDDLAHLDWPKSIAAYLHFESL